MTLLLSVRLSFDNYYHILQCLIEALVTFLSVIFYAYLFPSHVKISAHHQLKDRSHRSGQYLS